MESSKSHIIKYIESLKANFPDIRVRYAFEDKTHYHVVEIEPEETFTSIEFTSNLLSFWEDFTEKYPTEDIVISEPTVLNDMSNLIFE